MQIRGKELSSGSCEALPAGPANRRGRAPRREEKGGAQLLYIYIYRNIDKAIRAIHICIHSIYTCSNAYTCMYTYIVVCLKLL